MTTPKLRDADRHRLYNIALSDSAGQAVPSLGPVDRLLVDAGYCRAERRAGTRGLRIVATDLGRDLLEREPVDGAYYLP